MESSKLQERNELLKKLIESSAVRSSPSDKIGIVAGFKVYLKILSFCFFSIMKNYGLVYIVIIYALPLIKDSSTVQYIEEGALDVFNLMKIYRSNTDSIPFSIYYVYTLILCIIDFTYMFYESRKSYAILFNQAKNLNMMTISFYKRFEVLAQQRLNKKKLVNDDVVDDNDKDK